jgi:ribosome-binding protein aMBF1 (putative translation factor)
MAGTTRRGRTKKVRPLPDTPIPEEKLVFHHLLGTRVRERRLASGWTPKDLASRSGLTGQSIRNVEAGRGNVQAWTIYCLAKALGVPAGWLAFGG